VPARLDEPWNILVTGIGGTGVVTIGALLGMAAHLEEKGVSVLDMTGLAQKGGAVISHIRIAETPGDIHAVRVAAGMANLLIGCDLVVSASADGLSRIEKGRTRALINAHETITSQFTRNPDFDFNTASLRRRLEEAADAEFLDATQIATGLLGDSIATNLFMLGYAFQKGLVPLTAAAIERAIELNGVAIDFNKQAFLWGRRAAHDLPAVARAAAPEKSEPKLSESFDELVQRRVAFLTDYQDAAWAKRYEDLVRKAARVEDEKLRGSTRLADAVAKSLFKLMSYKDEYEVARLWSDTGFLDRVAEEVEGDWRPNFHLAPPLFAERDPATGHLKKRAYGPWMLRAFRMLAKFRHLRGTRLDPFGRTVERRMERQLIGDYEAVVEEILRGLTPENHATAVALASVPLEIRGFGHVKEGNLARAKKKEAELLAAFRAPPAPQVLAAE
jgi:indolepyruvate ferredoxin oxidoreductase